MKFCGDGRRIIGNFTRSRTAGSILPAVSSLMRNRVLCFIGPIFPQAIFSPEFPEGWEVKSSGLLWMTRVRPSTSSGLKASV